MNERLREIDLIKGVLIIAVISIHISGHFMPTLLTSPELWFAHALVNRSLQFAVGVFLTLSSYLLVGKLEGVRRPRRLWVSRTLKLSLPFLVCSILGLWVTFAHAEEPLTFRHAVRLIIIGKAYFHLYYMVLLFQLTAVHCALKHVFSRLRTVGHMAIAAVVQTAIYAINHSCPPLNLQNTILWYLLPIAMGSMAFNNGWPVTRIRCPSSALATFSVVSAGIYLPAAVAALAGLAANTTWYQIGLWAWTCSATLGLMSWSQSVRSGNRMYVCARFLGRSSFSIYLFHPFVIRASDHFGVAAELPNGVRIVAYWILCILVPVGGTMLLRACATFLRRGTQPYPSPSSRDEQLVTKVA